MKLANSGSVFLLIIKWIAYIWGGLAASFLIFMVLAHLVESGGWGWPSGIDGIAFVFFPVGVAAGLVIAMKWHGWGGLITIFCIAIWHILMNSGHGNPDFEPMIDGMAAPGLLFLLIWFMSRNRPHNKQD